MSPLTAVSRAVPDGPEGAPVSPRGPAGSWSSPQESPPGTESCFSPRQPPPAAGRSGGGSAAPGGGSSAPRPGGGAAPCPPPRGPCLAERGAAGSEGTEPLPAEQPSFLSRLFGIKPEDFAHNSLILKA